MLINAEAGGFSAAKLDKVRAHLQERYVATGKIAGCQVLVSRHGYLSYFESLGEMDRERGKPVGDNTMFRIYSMTKPITSVALMMLFEEGLFQLNDPVYKFIPAWREHRVWVSGRGNAMQTRPPQAPMTMRHILSHTAGLTYGALLAPSTHPVDEVYQGLGAHRGDGETLDSFVAKLAQVPLLYDPGSKWCYSLATDVCGYLVEKISGQKFEDFLAERIFNPLQMHDTGFSVPTEKTERFAANYRRAMDKSLKLEDDPLTSKYLAQPTFVSGGGGLVSTSLDYARFCQMLLGQGRYEDTQLISRKTLALMTQNHLFQGGDLTDVAVGSFSETAYEGVGFGLGFAATIDPCAAGSVSVNDYYWGGAASTIFWVDPSEELISIMLTQIRPYTHLNIRPDLATMTYQAVVD